MWLTLSAIATFSMGLHLLLLQIYSAKKLRECIRYRDWFEAILPIGATGGCLLAYYVTLKQIVPSIATDGWMGAIKTTVTLGPEAIGVFNEFLADLMADIIVIGFIPGGKIGFVIGMSLSILLNIAEFWLAADWLKGILRSPK